MITTIAQQIAADFDHAWTLADVSLFDHCAAIGYHARNAALGIDRIEFDDCSAIVMDGPEWDVEGDRLWSFASRS